MIEAELNSLRDRIVRQVQLEDLTAQWCRELPELIRQVEFLHAAMVAEQTDVDKLEAGGIGTVFHKLTGRMEEKLDKERLEAKTASDEYHAAAARLEALRLQLSEGESELESLRDCRAQYSQRMLDQIHQLEAMYQDCEATDQAEELKIRLQLERRRKSLREALLEGTEAHRAACRNLESLLQGQENPELLQQTEYIQKISQLALTLMEETSDLQAKLAQMGIDPDPHITIGAFLKAPNVFLIGAGENSSPIQQAEIAIQQINQLQSQITQIEDKLTEALSQIESAISRF